MSIAKNIAKSIIAKSILYKLAKSNNLWQRRISIIATFAFIKNNQLNDTIMIL
ncbi:MAG: DNA alkylation repair protein [bacterium]